MSAAGTRDAARDGLRSDVASAARLLAPMWPLETFIAVNPLGGLEDRPFDEAVEIAGRVFGARGTLAESDYRAAYARGRITAADLRAALARRHPDALEHGPVAGGVEAEHVLLGDLLHGTPAPPPAREALTLAERFAPDVAATVDAQAAKWAAAFVDGGQAHWTMPGRERGFYAAWRDLGPRDPSLPKAVRARLSELTERADDAALEALEALGVQPGEHRAYVEAHLTSMPGWAAHIRWLGDRQAGIDLVDWLAVRLALEAALLTGLPLENVDTPPAGDRATPDALDRARRVAESLGRDLDLAAAAAILEEMPPQRRTLVWLDAYEGRFRDGLLARLADEHEDGPPAHEGRPAAQVVCCIDVRSEGLRRHLEALGPYETLGFAGFFAVAMRFQDLAGGAPSALCPVLLEPGATVREQPAEGAEGLAERSLAGRRTMRAAEDGFHAAKDDLVAPFVLAEASGWAAGPLAAVKTLLAGRYGATRERLARKVAPPAPTSLSVREAFPLEERVLFAETALTTMGLTRGFGRVVVLCGHGSRTENNPYASALDCGACGGNRGGPSARTAAAILNGDDVREQLAGRGIAIPGDTWFVAAEHDTASDRVELLDRHLVPAMYHEELDRLTAHLADAGAALSEERLASLPGAPRGASGAKAARHARARGADWSQVFPEWGLAGNAAFIVGPRSLTRGIDLERRAFLHSYDAEADGDGAALELILTAPLVVAQWINCQYLFSTVDPAVFGAGTKTIHNVVGGIGVLAGQDGDLQLGLPWQSVADGERLVHEPMRLLAVVEAPLERIDAIVERHTVLQHLFGNEWVALAAREGPGRPWQRRTADGWERASAEAVLA